MGNALQSPIDMQLLYIVRNISNFVFNISRYTLCIPEFSTEIVSRQFWNSRKIKTEAGFRGCLMHGLGGFYELYHLYIGVREVRVSLSNFSI